MASPKNYSTFADFERDTLRPDMRIGWSSSDEIESTGAQELDFDLDPFESKTNGVRAVKAAHAAPMLRLFCQVTWQARR